MAILIVLGGAVSCFVGAYFLIVYVHQSENPTGSYVLAALLVVMGIGFLVGASKRMFRR